MYSYVYNVFTCMYIYIYTYIYIYVYSDILSGYIGE